MKLYRLSLRKALIAFIIDIIGYLIFGLYILIRKIFFRKNFSPASILLLRLDHMGDVLMATPAIIALKKHFPSAEITVGVKEVNRSLISLPKVVDRVIGLDVPWVNRYEDKKKQWSALLGKIKELRKEKFDLAIDFKGDLRNIILLFLIGGKTRVSYGIRGGGFLLTKKVKYVSCIRHEIDRNLDIVKDIAGDVKREVPQYNVVAQKEANIEKSFKELFSEKGRLIGIHPGANSCSKAWPLSFFAKLTDKIEQGGLAKVVIFLGPNEKESFASMKSSLSSNPLILDNLSIENLAAFFKKLDLFIGNDSGPFHLAEAVGTKVITIFGSTYPGIVGPIAKGSKIIKSNKFCAPCRMPGQREKCNGADCLKEISVGEVYAVVKNELIN